VPQFSFADTSSSAWLDFYLKGGLKNMEREVAAYDLLNAGDNAGPSNDLVKQGEVSNLPSLALFTMHVGFTYIVITSRMSTSLFDVPLKPGVSMSSTT
jgi:hypothetical protein